MSEIVAMYARVSSDRQAEAGTICSQVEALRTRARSDGLALQPEHEFVDDGVSGATLLRPALERLRDLAAFGGLDRVYILAPDRLARNYAHQVLILEELQRQGVQVVFLNQGVGDSPEERLLLQVQGMIAEYERVKILERSRRGKLHAARRGSVSVFSQAPFGYRYVRRGDGTPEFEIQLYEAGVVKRIFEWVGRDRVSINEVCRRLTKEGERTPKGRSFWHRGTIWAILKNPAYKGLAAYGKTRRGPRRPRLRPQRGAPAQPRMVKSVYRVPQAERIEIPVPPLVSEELFDGVEEQLAENHARARRRRGGAKHLLQGLVRCGRCGYAFYCQCSRVRQSTYGYYRCAGRDPARFGGERICDNGTVRGDLLEEAVWCEVKRFLLEPERVTEEFQRRLEAPSPENDQIERLKSKIRRLRQGTGRLIDTYTDGHIDKADFDARIASIAGRLRPLESKLGALAEQAATTNELKLIVARLDDFRATIGTNLEQADWKTKRQLMETLVKHIEVNDGDVEVVFRVEPRRGSEEASRLLRHCSTRVGVLA